MAHAIFSRNVSLGRLRRLETRVHLATAKGENETCKGYDRDRRFGWRVEQCPELRRFMMGENSKIEWCDHTFNPWIGCQKVSPGCDHCYAEAMMDHRYKKKCNGVHAASVNEHPSKIGRNQSCGMRKLAGLERKMAVGRGYFAHRSPTYSTIRLIRRGAMTCSR